VLHAILELRGGENLKRRLSALNTLERIFLSAVERQEDSQASTVEEAVLALGIESAAFRVLSKRLVEASQDWERPEDYANSLISIIIEGFAEFELPPRARLKVIFPKPRLDLWTQWCNQVDGLFADSSLGWQWSNIHQVKGGEFDAVLLSVPSKARGGQSHALDDWENHTDSEQRRVLYVGASRARRLLMFWSEGQRHQQLLNIFDRDGIPYLVT
jgi:superfamily I DNA/RNA helicase